MPRSGYDNTNCTNSEKQRTEGPLQTSTDTPRTVAGTIRIPRAFPLLGTDSNQPYSSTSRISIAPRPATAQLPSYTPSLPSISSIISAHRPYSVPFQENSTNIQSSPASTSANPTISPTPPLPRPSINRIALPTVRVSPGYVEHTGGYRVYNNSTGRGWRYSELAVGATNSVGLGSQQEPNIRHRRSRRQRSATLHPRSCARINRRPRAQTQGRREIRHQSIRHHLNAGGHDFMLPKSSASDAPRSEGQQANEGHARPELSGTPANLGMTDTDNSRKEEETSRRIGN